MTVEADPSGGLFGVISLTQPTALVIRPWEPNKPPVSIAPGELDTTETTRRRLYWQWQQGPNWIALVGIIGTAWQSVVNEHFEISEFRWLSTAFGVTLDELGALVDLARFTILDDLYRRSIGARGASLWGDAGIDAVMRPAKAFLGPGNVEYVPDYPRAFCYLVKVALSAELLDLLVELLRPRGVFPCGVGAKILLAPPDSPGWDWSTPQSWASSWSSIYGDVDLSVVSPWSWSVAL